MAQAGRRISPLADPASGRIGDFVVRTTNGILAGTFAELGA